MAHKGLRQAVHRGFHTGATDVPSASTPKTCPLCDDTPDGVQGKNGHLVLQTHLMERHQPDTRCPREHRGDADPEWRLDFDAILHNSSWRFYCSECGHYYAQA
jgi:hypothetical protein